MVDLLGHALEKRGFAVHRGRDGIDAFSHLFAHMPALMLIDLHLPCMTGLEVIEQIRTDRRMSSLPILAMSADTELLAQARRAGADAVLPKPFDLPELVALLERYAVH
jgi:CheY-like chemotaxis protein